MKKLVFIFYILIFISPAAALETSIGKHALKLTGFGTIGSLTSNEVGYMPWDWRIRGQYNYAVATGQTLGAVYSLDQLSIDYFQPARDAFLFFEDANIGRAEVGWTDSVVAKLSVGLPDVGGLRINDSALLGRFLRGGMPMISRLGTVGTQYAPRINIASIPTMAVQYGASLSGISEYFDYAADIGLKWRQSLGKTKYALSAGAGWIANPTGLQADIYTPAVNADWRGQASIGFNLQYNSFIWGTAVRAIYDQNPAGPQSDGISAGTGVSYDFLEYTASLNYLISDIGVWHDGNNFLSQTMIASARYKYTEKLELWLSGGITDYNTVEPFISAGIKLSF
ncbi:MAG: hypothetical protein LBO08_03470 [Rickettsiales bacterium]|jgi:hypothetical protein|nr:hypothetical protein [Rickettsiales bacterium]